MHTEINACSNANRWAKGNKSRNMSIKEGEIIVTNSEDAEYNEISSIPGMGYGAAHARTQAHVCTHTHRAQWFYICPVMSPNAT